MSLVEDLGKPWVDSSKLKCFRLCPRKYFWRYELGIVPALSESTDLAFGSGIHKGLETFYAGSAFELVPDHSRYARDGKIRRMFKEFLDLFPEHLETKYKTRQAGLLLLANYAEHWKGESLNVISVEQPAIMDMGDYVYVTKMDLVVEDTDGIHPWDHKTASRFDAIFEGSFKIDIQITGYIAAVRRLFGSRARKAIINALKPSAKISNDNFLRKLTYRTDEELAAWEDQVKFMLTEIDSCRESDVWPMHDYACFAYYRECEYRPLCLSSNIQRPEIIERSYRRDVWEPV